MAETQELRLKINAAAARAGAREFVAAINSIQTAVNQLERESTKAFDRINSGSKGLGQNLRGLQDGYNSARVANDRFAASVKRANAALTRQLNLASQSRGALSGGAPTGGGGGRAADQQIASQNRIKRAVDDTKVSVERLTASLMKVGGFESINKIAAAYRTFQKEVSGAAVSSQKLDDAKTKLNSSLKAAQASLITLNAKAQENVRAERAAAQAAREHAKANKAIEGSSKAAAAAQAAQAAAANRQASTQLAAAAAIRQAEQETVRLTTRLRAVGDTRGVNALNQSLIALKANLASGASSTIQVRQAMSQFADTVSRTRIVLTRADAAQRATAARAKELAAAETRAAAEARRLAGELRGSGAAAQAASRSFGAATGSLRGLENAFSSSFQIGSAFRTMIGTITLGTFAQSVFRAGDALEQFNITMEVASGSAAAAAGDLAFIDDMARRLGTNLEASRDAFSKFAVSSQIAGVSADQTRNIFESVSTAMSVLGRGTEDQRLAFLALEQMMSKGVISAEELRRQLGERLPGAVSLMARAVGVSVSELQDMLKAGELISSEVLPKFAEELNRTFGSQLNRTFNRAGSNLGRMQVEFQKLLEIVANSGFLDELAVQFRDITSALQSSDVQDAAAKLGRGFAEAAELFGQSALFIINNIEEIGRIATIVIGTLVVRQFALLAQSAASGVAAMISSIASFRALGAAGATAATGLNATTAASARATSSITASGVAATATAGRMAKMSAGLAVAGRVFGVMAGPIGLAISALTLVPAIMGAVGSSAQDAAFDYGDAIREMEGTTFRFLDTARGVGEAGIAEDIRAISNEIVEAQALLRQFRSDSAAQGEIDSAFSAIISGGVSAATRDALDEMRELNAVLLDAGQGTDAWFAAIDQLKEKFNEIRSAIPEEEIRRLEDAMLPSAALLQQIREDYERLENVAPGFNDQFVQAEEALRQANASLTLFREGYNAVADESLISEADMEFLRNQPYGSAIEALDTLAQRISRLPNAPDSLVESVDRLAVQFQEGEISAGELQSELNALRPAIDSAAAGADAYGIAATFSADAALMAADSSQDFADRAVTAENAAYGAQGAMDSAAAAADNVAAGAANAAAQVMSLAQAFATLSGSGSVAIASLGDRLGEIQEQTRLRSLNFVDRAVATEANRNRAALEAGVAEINSDFAAASAGQADGVVAALGRQRDERIAALNQTNQDVLDAARELATTPLNNEGRPTTSRSSGSGGRGRGSSGGRGRSGASDAAREAERAAKAIQDLKDALDESLESIETENLALGMLASGMTTSERGARLLAEAQMGGANLTREQTQAFIEQIEAAEALNASLSRLANDPVNDWMNSVPTWREAGQQIEKGVFESLSSTISEFIKTGEFSFEALGESILGIVADIIADKAVKELTTLLGGNTTGSGEGGFGLGGLLSDAFGNGGSAGDVADPFAAGGDGGAAMQQAIAQGGTQAAESMRQAITQAGQQLTSSIAQGGQQAGAQMGTQVQTAGTTAGAQMGSQVNTAGTVAGVQMGTQVTTSGTSAATQMNTQIQQGGAMAAQQMGAAVASGGGGGGGIGGMFGGFGGMLLGAGIGLLSGALARRRQKKQEEAAAARNAEPVTPVGIRQFAEGTANTSGIPAILHPNEAVIPLTKGRKVAVDMGDMEGNMGGSKTVVQNFNISTPDADSFRKSQKQIAADAASSGQRAMTDNG